MNKQDVTQHFLECCYINKYQYNHINNILRLIQVNHVSLVYQSNYMCCLSQQLWHTAHGLWVTQHMAFGLLNFCVKKYYFKTIISQSHLCTVNSGYPRVKIFPTVTARLIWIAKSNEISISFGQNKTLHHRNNYVIYHFYYNQHKTMCETYIILVLCDTKVWADVFQEKEL